MAGNRRHVHQSLHSLIQQLCPYPIQAGAETGQNLWREREMKILSAEEEKRGIKGVKRRPIQTLLFPSWWSHFSLNLTLMSSAQRLLHMGNVLRLGTGGISSKVGFFNLYKNPTAMPIRRSWRSKNWAVTYTMQRRKEGGGRHWRGKGREGKEDTDHAGKRETRNEEVASLLIISNLSQRLCARSPPVLPGGPLGSSSSTCRSTPSSLGVAALPPRHRQPPITISK